MYDGCEPCADAQTAQHEDPGDRIGSNRHRGRFGESLRPATTEELSAATDAALEIVKAFAAIVV